MSARRGTIAYSRVTEGHWQIWTYDLATGVHTQRTRSGFDKREPGWRRDGTLVFRNHNDELFVLAPEARVATPFRPDVWPAFDAAWAPDGSQVALAKMRTDLTDASAIWVVGAARGEQRVLTRGPGLWVHPDWSSDGGHLTYILSFGYRGSELRTVRLFDGKEQVLLADPHHNTHPVWSPDDRSIAFSSDRTGDYEIYLREVSSNEERRVTTRPGLDTRPSFSPDGTRIAYASLVAGRMEIWTTELDGRGAARLFACEDDVTDPAWR